MYFLRCQPEFGACQEDEGSTVHSVLCITVRHTGGVFVGGAEQTMRIASFP